MDSIILKSFFPEIFLSFFILCQLFFNAYVINNLKYNYPFFNKEIFSQCLFVIVCTLCLLYNNIIEGYFFNFLFMNDLSIKIVKILILFSCLFMLLPLIRSFNSQNLNFFEYFSIFLISVLSSLLLVSVADMMSAYLIIEMQALSFYVLASFKRNSAFSAEAGLKYFISGSFISGIFLLGCSLIYGVLGTLNFNHLLLLLSIPFSKDSSVFYGFLLIGILLITIVFLFKISSVPFHFWSPDVYEGAPLSSTIIFSIIPKFSIFYIFLKWVSIVDLFFEVKVLLIASGLLSIFFGSFLALKQKRLKRLIIYSSIGQVGFLVTALSNTTVTGWVSIYFFLIIYIMTSLLVWSNFALFYSFQNKINIFNKDINKILFLSTLSSFFSINKVWSFSNLLIFFSLAGIPPLIGFFAKILIIYGILESNNLACAFSLIIISAISVFYYLRIIKNNFF